MSKITLYSKFIDLQMVPLQEATISALSDVEHEERLRKMQKITKEDKK